MAMKILVYCPTNPLDGIGVHPETAQSALNLEWSLPMDVVFGKYDGKRPRSMPEQQQSILAKYVAARHMALDGLYEALLTIEADIIVPPTALKRLVQVDADVVHGLYVSRHFKHRWLACSRVGHDFRATSLTENPKACLNAWGHPVETAGVGLGCTLIWRHVLEQIEFRCPSSIAANDWFFALDLQDAGFRQVHHCDVICGHIDKDRILWPTANGGYREDKCI